MEREIKFRGYNEGWHYGCYLKDARANINGTQFLNLHGCKIADFIVYSNDKGFNIVEVIPESVGEFIVREDGNDIYENDIIEDNKHGRKRTFVAEDIRTFTREYDKSEYASVWKIIGNKFQNPELLKKE